MPDLQSMETRHIETDFEEYSLLFNEDTLNIQVSFQSQSVVSMMGYQVNHLTERFIYQGTDNVLQREQSLLEMVDYLPSVLSRRRQILKYVYSHAALDMTQLANLFIRKFVENNS